MPTLSHAVRLAVTTVLAAAALLAIAGCQEENDQFCDGNPTDLRCLDTPPPQPCSSNSQCMLPTAVCDTMDTKTCVQCTDQEKDACTGTTPACVNHECQACTMHAQCPDSSVCLPTGSCAAAADVAYVQAGGSGTACSLSAPCGTLDDGVKADKAIVKITGTVADDNVTVIDGKAITILADPGAKLDRSNNGVILEVKSDGADVQIFDLEISGGRGPGDPALSVPSGGTPRLTLTRVKIANNEGLGVSAATGMITISQSTIADNTGGGASINNVNQFVIVGNVFSGNGRDTSSAGAVNIQTTMSDGNKLEFNSFSKNQAQGGVGQGINCFAGTFTARNNIVSDNGTPSNALQIGGTCGHAYSIVRPGVLPAGPGNLGDDPLFVNPTAGNLHLQPTSPAAGKADPSSNLATSAARDIDGDTRSNPADIGADELP